MFLIDTDVLSTLRRRERSPDIVRWIAAQRTTDLYLSVVSIGEIERGIAGALRRDPALARSLAGWLDTLIALYAERILPVDLSAARRWGRLSAAMGHEGADLLIAAMSVIARLESCDDEFTVQEVVEESRRSLDKPFSSSHVSQMLVTLAAQGLVYKNRHGKYSFAVPLLGRFIRRQTAGS